MPYIICYEGLKKFFFLWVYLKSKVYFNRPNNLEDLWQIIRAETEQISPDIIERSVQCR
jgi:hypothetical protein